MMHLRAAPIWAILVIATLLSWFLKGDAVSARLGATAVILIAAFKINLVVGHFMELQWQPRPFRIVVSVWLAVVTIIIGGYWAA
jgi:cytochrome c oxidase subunit IV